MMRMTAQTATSPTTTPNAIDIINNSKRIVIKIGSSLLIDTDTGAPKLSWLHSFADDVIALHNAGKEIAIVSSGAIGLGRKYVGIDYKTPSKDIPLDLKQAAAAVGQIHLAQLFQQVFSSHGVTVAQILLRPQDTEDRESHLNARATFGALLSKRIIPIINENDTTATAEIQYGGNDPLSARVSQMIGADTLLILSTTDGLYTDDPRVNENAKHIPFVEGIDNTILALAKEPLRGISTGGMKSKIESARIAVNAGSHVIITNGLHHNPVKNIGTNTIILSQDKPYTARKKWILAHVTANASVTLDDGAVNALRAGKSLLPAGIISISGSFESGDAVKIVNNKNELIAVGLTNYNSIDTHKIKGVKSSEITAILGMEGRDEFIHRDNLTMMD